MHHEHRTRDLEQARASAERGLGLCARLRAPLGVRQDFERRLARLARKRAGRGERPLVSAARS
jgi:hypothetical protein